MIAGNNVEQAPALSQTQQMNRAAGSLLAQKIWLPKSLYAALPCFYLVSGIAALVATMYISHWSWVLPHYLIFSVACLHMGALILRRRKQAKKDPE